MKAAQNRTGLTSAASHDSQDVTPGARAAAQLDSSTLLPTPADPTTTVSRRPAPAPSRSPSADLVTKVVGNVAGRNLASANRAPHKAPCPTAVLSATPLSQSHAGRTHAAPVAANRHAVAFLAHPVLPSSTRNLPAPW
jgi:hypothetical protein